jgi:cell division protein FtsB
MAEPARSYEYHELMRPIKRTQSRRGTKTYRTQAQFADQTSGRKSRQSSYVMEIRKSEKNIFLRVLVYVVILLGGLLCVFSAAYLEQRKMALSSLDRELNQIRIENNVLRGQIHDRFDLTEVENYALNVLGMVRPNESQFVYVDEIRLGYAVRHSVEEVEIRPLDIIGDMFRSIFGIVRTE